MCGIVGILSRSPEKPVDPARLTRMRDALVHRGPDDAGLWTEGGVGLGFRRLSIVDLAGGHQPMTNESGDVWLVYNGEIYNHAELRPGLQARGHRYRTRSDSETIVHLYEEDGERAVEHLHGMFAFAIWDRTRRTLTLARDRLGIKPLYYALTDDELLFASEIKALVAGGLRPVFDESVVPEFLATRFVSGDRTFFRGVKKLPPGHTLTWPVGGDVRRRRYWQLPPAAARAPRGFAAEAAELRERLRAAVRRHLMSDVPLGVFLSGGIDSSALAALTAGLIDEPVRTFAVGFAEAEANELPFARLVARHIGSEHREVLVSPREFFDALPGLIYQEDEPIAFTSSVPLYFVSRLARQHVKVVLTGEGADELFLGYNRYRVTLWNARLGRPFWLATPRWLRARLRQGLGALPRRLRRYPERTFLALEPGARALFFDNFAVFPDALRSRIVAERFQHGADPYAEGLRCYAEGRGPLDGMSRADLQTYLHELLMKQDQMSMAASIESRVPFLDDDIIEHVAALPGRLKLRGWQTKAVMRAAVRDLLPPAILTRKKMGFPVPLGRWLRAEFWPLVEQFVLGPRARARRLFVPEAVTRLAAAHRSGAEEHGDRLWLLINLELWLRVVIEGERPTDVLRPEPRSMAVPQALPAAVRLDDAVGAAAERPS